MISLFVLGGSSSAFADLRAAGLPRLALLLVAHDDAHLLALLEQRACDRGMRPTARAEAMAGPLERALEDLGRALAAPAPFDPARSTRKLRIATNDYIELLLLPRLLARMWSEAPGVDVRVTNLREGGNEDLAEGRVDVTIGVVNQLGEPAVPQGLRYQRVFSDRFVCVVREGHPLVGKRLSLDDFVSVSHALVAPRGTSGSVVDSALAALGKKRRVAIAVPHFLVAPHVVRETDVVLTLAERVAKTLAPLLGLRQLAPPLELSGFFMSMVWHERRHGDAAHVWLRRLIASVAKEQR